ALEELRGFDQKLGSLFAPARPSPAIEDRMIQSLRTKSQRRWRPHWIVSAAAAVILFGCVGALAESLLQSGVPNLAAIFRDHVDFDSVATENNLNQGSLGDRRDEKWVTGYKREETAGQSKGVFETTPLEAVEQIAKEEADKNTADLLNSTGYY